MLTLDSREMFEAIRGQKANVVGTAVLIAVHEAQLGAKLEDRERRGLTGSDNFWNANREAVLDLLDTITGEAHEADAAA